MKILPHKRILNTKNSRVLKLKVLLLGVLFSLIGTLKSNNQEFPMSFEQLEQRNWWFCKIINNDDVYFAQQSFAFQIEQSLMQQALIWQRGHYNKLKDKLKAATEEKVAAKEDQSFIPRILHFIWFGPVMPKQRQDLINTWIDKHPHWCVEMWDEQKIATVFPNGLINQGVFDEALRIKNYGKASDVARYEILEKFGGLYVDSDQRCLKKFDIFNQNFEFYAGSYSSDGIIINNAIIGSIQEHPILKECINIIKQWYSSDEPLRSLRILNICPAWPWFYSKKDEYGLPYIEEAVFTVITTGPAVLMKAIYSFIKACSLDILEKVLILPSIFFYIPWNQSEEDLIKLYHRHCFSYTYHMNDWWKDKIMQI